MTDPLKQSILNEAHRLGFVLAGVTTPDPTPHVKFFEDWLARGRHAEMAYLATDRARAVRADPRLILPECESILVLGVPYNAPLRLPLFSGKIGGVAHSTEASIASYALGEDYHLVLPPRLQQLVQFIETQVGRPVPNRYYTDTGPLLERDLAQRAGLGWIGKNTCLIHPQKGSYFLLAEILLGLALEPDAPFTTDHCGTCTRCLEACPTRAILPDRSLDAGRCISYLTIENKGSIPEDLRPRIGNWIFGCDICQIVCPWNRFAAPEGDASFQPCAGAAATDLIATLALTPESFNRQFKRSPIQRAKRRGLLRNASVALGNIGDEKSLPALENAPNDSEPLIRTHAAWAKSQIEKRKSEIQNGTSPRHQ